MGEFTGVNDNDQGLEAEAEAEVMGMRAVAGVVQAMQESGNSIQSTPYLLLHQRVQSN